VSNKRELPAFSEEDTISPDESPVFGDSVENLPTAHIEAAVPEPPAQKSPGMQKTRDFNDASQESALPQIPATPAVWNAPQEDVTQLPTSRFVSRGQVKPGDLLKQQEATQIRPRPMQPEGVIFQKPPSTPQLGAKELQDFPQAGGVNRTPRPLGSDKSAMGAINRPLQEAGRPGTRPVSPKRLVLVLALLVLLVIAGVAAWMIAAKPFGVASITEPWQQFCDAGPGVSGQYPTGWSKRIEKKRK
jgi:hypothetical protein